MKELKINLSHLLCGLVIFVQLIWMQTKVIWPSAGGIAYYIIYYMKYFGAAILLFYTLFKRKDKEVMLRQKKYISIFIPLFLLFVFIEWFALIQSPLDEQYGMSFWSRSMVYILDKICILIEVSCIWILCKKDTIKCISNALIFDGLLLLFLTIIKTDIVSTLKTFLVVFGIIEGNEASQLLEIHELTYCIGLCIIYYLYFCYEKTKMDKIRLILLILLFILGGKRIGFAGIIIGGIFALFVHKKGLSIKSIASIGIIGTIFCIMYVYFLYDGEVMSYLSYYGIDVMGRDYVYNYFIKRTDFSFTNLGWGLSGVSKAIENMSRAEVGNMVSARGLHNDILKMYIECGFIGSILWYLFNLLYVPIKIFKKIGRYEATLYISLILFAFITYLTDNTENYFVFQVILILLPLASHEILKKKQENKEFKDKLIYN